jgi:hypothetical protein
VPTHIGRIFRFEGEAERALEVIWLSVEYWDKGAWSRYVKEDLLPLYRSCLTLLELERKLTELCNGKMLSGVIKEKPSVECIFVGGTSPPEIYEEKSLALAYYRLMGASVKLREYYFLKQHGKEPRTICTVTKTTVIRYIEHIGELLKRVMNHTANLALISAQEVEEAKNDATKQAEETISKPEILPHLFSEALSRAVNVTVAYNPFTQFIWHLRKIPKKYIEEFYPKMLDEETFQFLQQLLGLRGLITPRVADREIADLYTIFSFDHEITGYVTNYGSEIDNIKCSVFVYIQGYLPDTDICPYTSMGGCICRVNELIWGMFNICIDELALVVSEVPNPFDDWKASVGNKLPASGYRVELNYPKSYEDLSLLDDVLPAVFDGQLELFLSSDKEKIRLVSRW